MRVTAVTQAPPNSGHCGWFSVFRSVGDTACSLDVAVISSGNRVPSNGPNTHFRLPATTLLTIRWCFPNRQSFASLRDSVLPLMSRIAFRAPTRAADATRGCPRLRRISLAHPFAEFIRVAWVFVPEFPAARPVTLATLESTGSASTDPRSKSSPRLTRRTWHPSVQGLTCGAWGRNERFTDSSALVLAQVCCRTLGRRR